VEHRPDTRCVAVAFRQTSRRRRRSFICSEFARNARVTVATIPWHGPEIQKLKLGTGMYRTPVDSLMSFLDFILLRRLGCVLLVTTASCHWQHILRVDTTQCSNAIVALRHNSRDSISGGAGFKSGVWLA
jgi:hypothetical protein